VCAVVLPKRRARFPTESVACTAQGMQEIVYAPPLVVFLSPDPFLISLCWAGIHLLHLLHWRATLPPSLVRDPAPTATASGERAHSPAGFFGGGEPRWPNGLSEQCAPTRTADQTFDLDFR
jgi:hypothetical protein